MEMEISNSTVTNSGGCSDDQWFYLRDNFLGYRIDIGKCNLLFTIEDVKRSNSSYTYRSNFSIYNGKFIVDSLVLLLSTYEGGGQNEKYLNKPTIRITYENLDYYKNIAHLFFEIDAKSIALIHEMKAKKDPKKIHDIIEPIFKNYRLIFDSIYLTKKQLFTDIWSEI